MDTFKGGVREKGNMEHDSCNFYFCKLMFLFCLVEIQRNSSNQIGLDINLAKLLEISMRIHS